MKTGAVTKLEKRTKSPPHPHPPKKIDDDIISENCDVIVIFQIYS